MGHDKLTEFSLEKNLDQSITLKRDILSGSSVQNATLSLE